MGGNMMLVHDRWSVYKDYSAILPASVVVAGLEICILVSVCTVNPKIYAHCSHHDEVIKWKHFPCYWPFVRGIHWWPVNSPHKGQWCRALMFSLISAWINNHKTGDLRCHCTHYDITVMLCFVLLQFSPGRLHSYPSELVYWHWIDV